MVAIDFLKDVRGALDSPSQQRLVSYASNLLDIRVDRITLSPSEFYLITTIFGSEQSAVEKEQIIFEHVPYLVLIFVRDSSLPYENKCALITHS